MGTFSSVIASTEPGADLAWPRARSRAQVATNTLIRLPANTDPREPRNSKKKKPAAMAPTAPPTVLRP